MWSVRTAEAIQYLLASSTKIGLQDCGFLPWYRGAPPTHKVHLYCITILMVFVCWFHDVLMMLLVPHDVLMIFSSCSCCSTSERSDSIEHRRGFGLRGSVIPSLGHKWTALVSVNCEMCKSFTRGLFHKMDKTLLTSTGPVSICRLLAMACAVVRPAHL